MPAVVDLLPYRLAKVLSDPKLANLLDGQLAPYFAYKMRSKGFPTILQQGTYQEEDRVWVRIGNDVWDPCRENWHTQMGYSYVPNRVGDIVSQDNIQDYLSGQKLRLIEAYLNVMAPEFTE